MASNSIAQARQGGSGRRRAAIVAALLLAVTIVVGTVLWTAGAIGGAPPTLRDLLSQSSSIAPRDDTATLCVQVDCVEGWSTDAGIFLRFRTSDLAEYWHYVIGGDSIIYDDVLLDMNGVELTQDDPRYVIDTLFSRRDWRW